MRRIRRYLKNKEGTAAIEFAILAIPFFMLLFAVLELAVVFFINSTLNHAVSEAGRQIRTGNFQSCGTKAKFKELPPAPPEPDPTDPTATDDIPNGDWVNTTANAPVVIRGLYYHKLVLPPQLTRLETLEGKGIRLLGAMTAFKNEPFPAPGACPVT